jgi:hypothetical protein
MAVSQPRLEWRARLFRSFSILKRSYWRALISLSRSKASMTLRAKRHVSSEENDWPVAMPGLRAGRLVGGGQRSTVFGPGAALPCRSPHGFADCAGLGRAYPPRLCSEFIREGQPRDGISCDSLLPATEAEKEQNSSSVS